MMEPDISYPVCFCIEDFAGSFLYMCWPGPTRWKLTNAFPRTLDSIRIAYTFSVFSLLAFQFLESELHFHVAGLWTSVPNLGCARSSLLPFGCKRSSTTPKNTGGQLAHTSSFATWPPRPFPLDFGFWVLGFGFWILDFGFWVLDFGFRILYFEFRILDFGLCKNWRVFWILHRLLFLHADSGLAHQNTNGISKI